MRKISSFLLLSLTTFLLFSACSKSETNETATPPTDKEEEDNSMYEWERKRTSLLENNDMVLLYASGSHRHHIWSREYINPYVTYKDELGKEHWLFDSFLFLEIHTGNGTTFVTGVTDKPANQNEWKYLIDYYFKSQLCIGALNSSIEDAIGRLGEPSEKRKVVIAIPEPIVKQKNWGTLNKYRGLNFSNSNDRVSAVKWYIDYAREKFNEAKYKNLELAGFYWMAEEASNSRDILADVSKYLNELKYSFTWIPYNGADGAFSWKQLTFNYAFFQPNYFFSEDTPYSLLDYSCRAAKEHGMDMEIEFDERALVNRNNWGYRLDNYMKAFKEHGIWSNNSLAYYQGDYALYQLSVSDKEADQQLYHRFCKFVTERPN